MEADDNSPMQPPYFPDGIVRLAHLGVLRARGADAAKFLQSQLTNDVESMGAGDVRLAGFCSAKGRLQASFIVWRPAPDEFLLACAADLLPATLKRLSMFVLRAQCKLTDASAELPLFGAAGPSALARAGSVGEWQRSGAPGVLRLPDAGGVARAILADGAAQTDDTLPLATWRWLEVQSGTPLIEAATVDQFVPQMVNFELLQGVDFQKGCYPGQEIVARSQYRGTLKRRMFLFDVDAAAAPGQEIFDAADPGQPAGLVVNAAPRPDAMGWSALVEVKLSALAADHRLALGAADGAVLRRAALPYAVPVDAEPGATRVAAV
jgi:folate-binding protein YgfZ